MKTIQPMLCRTGTTALLQQPHYIFEPKIDGIRALCHINGDIKLISRNGNDITNRYPELIFRSHIKANHCILDGEITSFDKNGVPNFSQLQEGNPAVYIIFDILYKDHISLMSLPLLQRKKILAQTVIPNHAIEVIPFTKQGTQLWDMMVKYHGEGVVAKIENSTYQPSTRSYDWMKIKIIQTVDCIIVGYTQGKRAISSLALALYNEQGKLQYIGNVGTGFRQDFIPVLLSQLQRLKTSKVPVGHQQVGTQIKELPKDIIWVKPHLVCEVKYQEFTAYKMLRIARFVRLRDDKKPKQCTFAEQLP